MSTIVGSSSRRRLLQGLVLTLGVLSFALDMAGVPLDSITHQAGTGGPVTDTFTVASIAVPAAALGTLLAMRRPRNPIGWLLLLLLLGNNPSSQYSVLDYRMHHGTLPLGWLAVILDETWPLFLYCIAMLLWLFPDGKLPAGRWRRPSRILAGAGLLLALAGCSPGVIVLATHDVHIAANGDLAGRRPPALVALDAAVIAAAIVSYLAWLAVQIPAYRRASGERREQLKWLYSGAAIFVVAVFIGVFIVPAVMGDAPGWGTQPVVNALTTVGMAALPVCMGVAVLKYRLYEIDRIISRVISYAIITAVLAGVFALLVLLATAVLPAKTPVAIAAATLAAASLFNPLRRRVQRLVDRRFNRARYNGETIVADFTARLRHTVDLDTVRGDLVAAVHEAFEPTHVSVWLSGAQPASRDM